MKKILLPLIFLPFLAIAQNSPDTLLHVADPGRVVITESSEGTRVSVGDGRQSVLVGYPDGAKVSVKRNSVFNLPDWICGNNPESRKRKKVYVGIDGICLGLNDPMNQTGGGGLQWSKSFEISWLSCLNVGYSFSRSYVYLGLGFDWRTYRATADGRWLVPDGQGGVEWGVAPEGADVRSTQLKVFSLQLPLMYVWRIPKTYLKWRMGAILNFNTYASLKGVYDDAGGNRCEYFTREFDRRPVTLDFFGSLSYRNAVGVYVRVSPMKVLKTASPVNFQPLTVGVTLGI